MGVVIVTIFVRDGMDVVVVEVVNLFHDLRICRILHTFYIYLNRNKNHAVSLILRSI